MKIKLRPTSKASKRTKERIAQHGPVFWWECKAVDARRGEPEVQESTINIEGWVRELMPTSEELYYDENDVL
jgi:hypothetical protein